VGTWAHIRNSTS